MIGTRKTILIVEDKSTDRFVCRDILMPVYNVYCLTSGEKMFFFLGKVLPDLILLSIELKKFDIFEIFKRLKADERCTDIPIMLLSSQNDVAAKQTGFDLGAVDYIVKPFDPPTLLEQISKVIGGIER